MRLEDLIDEMFCVRIENNSASNISHNKILTRDVNNIFLNLGYPIPAEPAECFSRGDFDFDLETGLISGAHNRVVNNVEIFSRFIHHYRNSGHRPTVRVYGLFSSLSTNREKKNTTTDYDLLVLEEKSLLEAFVKQGFRVKACISLDVDEIFDSWGYTAQQFKDRLIDLSANLLALETNNKNLSVTFDTHNRMESTFILGDSVLIRAVTINRGAGYNTTLYSKERVTVDRAIQTFDDAFAAAYARDFSIRKQLWIGDVSDYIEVIVENRLRAVKGK